MTQQFYLEQFLNGMQYGVFLFLVAAGLTLIFGIMNIINLAHGSLFMVGAYAAALVVRTTGSFGLAIILAPAVVFALGWLIESVVLRRIYGHEHIDQVLATFGLLLCCNQAVVMLFGSESQPLDVPQWLAFTVDVVPGSPYPAFRLAVIAVGLAIAAVLWLVIARTRAGALVRAGASNRVMLGMLGVDVRAIYTWVFCAGAALAALAGVMAGPLVSVEPGMGDEVLILAFVVIVIGGIGSIRGAFIASLLVGLVEIAGRTVLKLLLAGVAGDEAAQSVAPAIASMSVYLLMVLVLFVRPRGLFAARTG
jgi:branched-chain amino acid transport system permease protein